jgi:tRNA (mo5U34)-methyltransferase
MDGPPRPEQSSLQARVDALAWYHSFDLPGGISTTGLFDHRKMVGKLPIPASLAGLRCLDLAASDGFWSFELARRGAAEVVSVDLPDAAQQDYADPSGDPSARAAGTGRANQAFALVKEATGLSVDRVDGSVYELDQLGIGRFDYVFMGNVLLHLRDPIRALQQVRTITKGEFLSFEAVSLPQTVLRPLTPTGQFALSGEENRFWTPNLRGHRRMVEAAGFEVVAGGGVVLQPLGRSWPRWPATRPRSLHELTFWLFTRQFGAASGWVRARPRN